jgi:hypothetical protein
MKMKTKTYRYGWLLIFVIVALSALACNAISNIGERARQIESAAQTAQALATTGQEIITQVQGSGVLQTAAALATQAEESGLVGTLQAVITEIPGDGKNVYSTVEVVLTQGAYGEAPSNIPLVNDEIKDFFGSNNLVSYTTPMDLTAVVDFYNQQMPNFGWQTGDDTTVVTSSYALLSFQNPDQKVTITLSLNPLNRDTIIIISISG